MQIRALPARSVGEEFPGRNPATGCPALQLRASSEQVTNHQLRTTPNILDPASGNLGFWES